MDMVSGFFGDDGDKFREFGRESLFGFCFFSSSSKFHDSGNFGELFPKGGPFVEETGATTNDLVKDLVVIGVRKELEFFLLTIVLKESGVSGGVDIGVSGRLRGGSLVKEVVAGGVSGVGEVGVFGLVKGFIDG